MYVQCERCKTEYDFDDALVSERGTTVKCTQCGNQFKVRRSTEGAGGDRWVVTTVSGKTHVFTSLRELQKAILGRQVARSDSLSRGSGPPRLLGAIAELEPFFDKRASVPPTEAEPLARKSSRPPPAAASGLQPPQRSPSVPPRGRMDTLRPTAGGVPAPAPAHAPREEVTRSPLATTQGTASAALANTPHVASPVGQPTTAEPFAPRPAHAPDPLAATLGAAPEPSATLPALATTQQSARGGTAPMPPITPQQVQQPQPQPRPQPIPAAMEMSSPLPPQVAPFGGSSDSIHPARPSLPDYAPPRRRVGGWIVGLVLVAGVSVLGFVVLKPYLRPAPKPVAALAPLDPKVQQLLGDGERAFSDGNLDAAKEDFDKASALADKDPRVLLDVARVAEARADVAWLALRLAAPGEQATQAKKDLDEHSVKASSAAETALNVAPDDAAAVRSKIDALRIAGDFAQARALVPKMSSIASQPESSYILAALDLAEATTPTPQVIERLRDAAASEGNLGRARAALVYALARSGDVPQARKELEKLLGLPHQHPLQADLRAFLDRSHQAAATGDAGAVAVVDVNSLPSGGHGSPSGEGNFGASDPRHLLQEADTAKSHGDLLKAKDLYGKVLAISPSDSEALAGLGDVSYQQHDLHNAQTYYENALRANNTYFPALIGLADTLWDLGDKGRAQRMYKDMVDRLPEQMVPARARQRSTESAPAPQATGTPASQDGGGGAQ